ncbi:MAG: matrixin family metalloprotease [Planctomycetaceae bacterium]
MRALSWCQLWLRRVLFPRPTRVAQAPWSRVECLETRQLLTINFQFDYSRDANHFFDDPARREILELAAETIGSRLNDHLQAIVPSGSNTWSLSVTNPSGASSFTMSNVTIAENTLLVFVGARMMNSLAIGGPGGYSVAGSSEWFDVVEARGQSGALNNPASDFGPWGGSISFDLDADWYFGSSEAGLGSQQHDFLSVAMHELGHLLGIGTADSWTRSVSGGFFLGSNARAEHRGNVLLSGSSHFQEGLKDGGDEAALDPSLLAGTRKQFTKLDFAALADIGWEVQDFVGGSGGATPAPATHTLLMDSSRAHTLTILDNADPHDGRSRLILDGVASDFINPTGELIISGGSKSDVILIQSLETSFAARITVNAGAGHDRVTASAVRVPVHLWGGTGRDTLIGGTGNDTLLGGNDNDRLSGNGGDDSLEGHAGHDVLDGGDDHDWLSGGAGNDQLLGGLSNDTLNGGIGNDTLKGGFGNDALSGFTGNDSLLGEAGRDTLFGGDGNDRLLGGLDDDLLRGGLGTDRVDGETGRDTLSGGNGSGKEARDTVVAGLSDLADELFVFTADWIAEV